MKKLKYTALLGLTFVLTILATSCEKSNDWSTDDSYNRLFRTSKMVVSPAAGEAEVTWTTTPNTEYYIIEVNTDSLFNDEYHAGSIIFGEDRSITKTPYTLKGLAGVTKYYIRIKSCSEAVKSSQWAYPESYTFTTKAEQILNEVSAITGNSAMISWEAGLAVTHLTIKGSEEVKRDLTEDEKSSGQAIISGLSASTSYTVSIWNGANERGSRKFSTTESYPDGYTAVNIVAGDDVNAVLAAQSGNIVLVIPHSTEIECIETVTVPESVSSIIFWGASGGASKATMKIKTVISSGKKEMVKFYNLNIDPQGGYLFNQQEIDTEIGAVIVDDCIIQKNSGVIRAKGTNAMQFGKAVINNCIVKDCSKALFAFKEATAALIPVIELTNSTIMNVTQQYFYLIKPTTILVDNCTLYGIGTSKSFLDLTDKTVNTTMNMKNTIIAKSEDASKSIKACNVKDRCVYENVFVASDCVFDSTMDANEYTGTAESLFEDPANGNFKIKDPMFTANTGDPRWKE